MLWVFGLISKTRVQEVFVGHVGACIMQGHILEDIDLHCVLFHPRSVFGGFGQVRDSQLHRELFVLLCRHHHRRVRTELLGAIDIIEVQGDQTAA